LEEMIEEIQDRFGPPPQECHNLLGLMSIRILLKSLGIIRLDVGHESITLTFSQNSKINTEKLLKRVGNRPDKFHFLPGNKLKFHMGPLSDPGDLKKIEDSIKELDLS